MKDMLRTSITGGFCIPQVLQELRKLASCLLSHFSGRIFPKTWFNRTWFSMGPPHHSIATINTGPVFDFEIGGEDGSCVPGPLEGTRNQMKINTRYDI